MGYASENLGNSGGKTVIKPTGGAGGNGRLVWRNRGGGCSGGGWDGGWGRGDRLVGILGKAHSEGDSAGREGRGKGRVQKVASGDDAAKGDPFNVGEAVAGVLSEGDLLASAKGEASDFQVGDCRDGEIEAVGGIGSGTGLNGLAGGGHDVIESMHDSGRGVVGSVQAKLRDEAIESNTFFTAAAGGSIDGWEFGETEFMFGVVGLEGVAAGSDGGELGHGGAGGMGSWYRGGQSVERWWDRASRVPCNRKGLGQGD